jgi:hypothetical protein
MTIEISSRIIKKFQKLQEFQDLLDPELKEYLEEIVEDYLEDLVFEKMNQQKENEEYDFSQEEEE